MTDDDTFNALKRDPFESVVRDMAQVQCKAITPDDIFITKSVWMSGNENLPPFWHDFFSGRGWTVKEFEKECKRDVEIFKDRKRK